MSNIKELYQSGDWKAEKHVPAIDAPDSVKKGETVKIEVGIGKEIAHPNTTEHHIDSVDVYFKGDGDKFPYRIGHADFQAHGASAEGPNTSTIYTDPVASISFKTEKTGTIIATSSCNIHGLWESSKAISVE